MVNVLLDYIDLLVLRQVSKDQYNDCIGLTSSNLFSNLFTTACCKVEDPDPCFPPVRMPLL